MKKTIIILVGLAIIIGAWFWASYNKLVTVNEAVNNKWAQVETQYQRRFDLIPNLVSAVKGAMGQERTVFEQLAAARANYTGAKTTNEKAIAASAVESSFGRLLAIMENYPQLRSVQTVQNLMVELEGTENRVAVARMRYNDEVRLFNTIIKRVPMNIVARLYKFPPKAYFKITAGAEVVPKVKFNF